MSMPSSSDAVATTARRARARRVPSPPVEVVHGIASLPLPDTEPSVVTVGFFDGVHLGHNDVIQHAVDSARELDARSALITFEPHPRCVLDPANCPPSITTLQEKLSLIGGHGVDHAIVIRFDRALASLAPQDFVEQLSGAMAIRRWVIGFDFAFGRGRTGNAEWLRIHGHDVLVVPPFKMDGHDLHSSEIRRLVNTGEIHEANRLLGREYSMAGPVEAGDRVGRRLGFPTANIGVEPNKLIPALGAYAGRARQGERDPSASYEFFQQARADIVQDRRDVLGRVAKERDRGPWKVEDVGTPIANPGRNRTRGGPRSLHDHPILGHRAQAGAAHVKTFVQAEDAHIIGRRDVAEEIPHAIAGPVRNLSPNRERGGR